MNPDFFMPIVFFAGDVSKKKRVKKRASFKALFRRLGCLEGKFVGAFRHVIIGVVREN